VPQLQHDQVGFSRRGMVSSAVCNLRGPSIMRRSPENASTFIPSQTPSPSPSKNPAIAKREPSSDRPFQEPTREAKPKIRITSGLATNRPELRIVICVVTVRHAAQLDRRSTKPSHENDSKSDDTVEESVQDRDCYHPETVAVSQCPRRAQKVRQLVADESLPSTIARVKHEHLYEATKNGNHKPCNARVDN